MSISHEIATQRIKKVFPWIIIPLGIEFEATEIDQSWYYKKPIKFGN